MILIDVMHTVDEFKTILGFFMSQLRFYRIASRIGEKEQNARRNLKQESNVHKYEVLQL